MLENVVEDTLVNELAKQVMTAINREVEYHGTKEYENYTRILLCSLYGGAFLKILEHEQFIQPLEFRIGNECILYTMTSSCLPPKEGNCTSHIHRDSNRIIPGYNTSIVGMLLLDDFTEDNGPTLFLPGSHKMQQAPDEKIFDHDAVPLIGKAGSVCYFDPCIWHRSTTNGSSNWRKSLLVYMIQPWMKQRFDIPRAMAEVDLSGASEKVMQKLGFLTQPPVSYDDFYQQSKMRRNE